MHNCVEASVDSSAVVIFVAKILAAGFLLIMCYMNSVANQFVDTFVFCSRNRNHGNSQHTLHQVNVHGSAVAAKLVHHVEGHNHGNVHLQKLHGEVEVPLDVCGVHDIYDCFGVFVKNEVTAHQLLA